MLANFLTFFTTIDPIGTLTIFVGLTAGMSVGQKKKIAWQAVGWATLILLLSVFLGQFVLGSLGIRLESFQLAGGIIFFLFGLHMVFGTGVANIEAYQEEGHDIAVFPLAVPSIANPGSILAAVVLTDNREFTIGEQLVTTGLMMLVLVMTLVLLLQAHRIYAVLGRGGSTLLIRVMGMILASLAVEMILQSLDELIPILSA